MSLHSVDIIAIGDILPHPNADRLEITHIKGWQCCIPKGQFHTGDHAVYIEPDYEVDLSHPSFAFLKDADHPKSKQRIKVRRFRGSLSQGLLISVPEDIRNLPVGSNVMDELNINRYEPPLPKSTAGDFVKPPIGIYAPVFVC